VTRRIETAIRMAVAMVGLGAVTLAGCGGVYDSSVSGMVTLDGNPVPRGTVSFHPASPGPAGYARIDSDGSYFVRTGREDGLPHGDYQVTVIASEPPAVSQSANGGPPPAGKPITPPWYRATETSGLKFTVQPGKNEINLELKSQPPAGWNKARRR
jgi:hypothetical protein